MKSIKIINNNTIEDGGSTVPVIKTCHFQMLKNISFGRRRLSFKGKCLKKCLLIQLMSAASRGILMVTQYAGLDNIYIIHIFILILDGRTMVAHWQGVQVCD